MADAEPEGVVDKGAKRDPLPWGIRFRYLSRGRPTLNLTVVRAAVTASVPGWDIQQAAGEDGEQGWFEAIPPPLPAHLVPDNSHRAKFVQRVTAGREGIAAVTGVEDAQCGNRPPAALISAFLDLAGDASADSLAKTLIAHVAANPALQARLLRWQPPIPERGRQPAPTATRLPLLRRLLKSLNGDGMSGQPDEISRLVTRLGELEQQEQKCLEPNRRGEPYDLAKLDEGRAFEPTEPPFRYLRAYSFDPSLATTLDTAPIHQVTIPARWESLAPGPIGEYLEVVDVDHASGCAYLPVDLEQAYIVAQDGLPPSEGNPQFHQQMVYAVAMNTIHRFEEALGRPVFWSPLRPWFETLDEGEWFTPPPETPCPETPCPQPVADADQGQDGNPPCGPSDTDRRSRFVQRLRIYPHALREANAYYSPTKRALLFGYFPNEGENNGMVFTCLSHDIIVHETTHAIVDGMHSYFNEPSNEDVWAFHEAFADIMALFQHFTYPEVLLHQISSTRGDLETDNLLGQMAQQFGQAKGRRGGLRNYLGGPNEEGVWERTKPDPQALRSKREPHERGSILVAAVFDAFLALYKNRVGDLLRIATGGTGILPAGKIHPDLALRLAHEAADAAEDVLSICIRAMDYLPPVDVTFGEFLRALITADYEHSSTKGHENRIAFIDAFRSWGIYPRDVTTLSEESLRWSGPEPGFLLQQRLQDEFKKKTKLVDQVTAALQAWRPGAELRQCLFAQVVAAQALFYCFLREMAKADADQRKKQGQFNADILPGLDLTQPFNVDNMRPTRSIGPLGEVRDAMIVEIVQQWRPQDDAKQDSSGKRDAKKTEEGKTEDESEKIDPPIRGGVTLIVDLQTWNIRYTIYKRLYQDPACARNLAIRGERRRRVSPFAARRQAELAANPAQRLAATYAPAAEKSKRGQKEPFAVLHRSI